MSEFQFLCALSKITYGYNAQSRRDCAVAAINLANRLEFRAQVIWVLGTVTFMVLTVVACGILSSPLLAIPVCVAAIFPCIVGLHRASERRKRRAEDAISIHNGMVR